jgi:hypothetical protein
LRFRAFSVAVKDLEATRALLKKNRIKTKKIAQRLVVDHAPGQGCVIAFEQAGKS